MLLCEVPQVRSTSKKSEKTGKAMPTGWVGVHCEPV
jgi:hypothetical protein